MSVIDLLKQREYINFLLIIILFIVEIIIYYPYSNRIDILFALLVSYFLFIAYFIYCIFLETEIKNHRLKILQIHLEKGVSILSSVVIIVVISVYFISFHFLIEYFNYQTDCPFIYNNISYNLHINKICELYNINNTSLYPYQYICSFNLKKEGFGLFNPTLNYILGHENSIRCFEVKLLKNNNDVIDKFVEEYYKEELYYCDLCRLPKEYPYVNYKYCRSYTLLDPIVLSILQFILIIKFIKDLDCYFRLITANVNYSIRIHYE